jgi:hypothetical protein
MKLRWFAVLLTAMLWAGDSFAQNTTMFGPNVYVFDPSMSNATIQTTLQSLSGTSQFGTQRFAVFFMPGTYNVQAKIGFYEAIGGLGQSPNAVTIDGFLTPNFSGSNSSGLTTVFWRSMENMYFNPATNTAQKAPPNTLQWGISQGGSLRRIYVNGDLELDDTGCGFASGGYISDTVVTGSINPCVQQQWYTRNSTIGSWLDGMWADGEIDNMVFSGVIGAPAQSFRNGSAVTVPSYTTVATTPVVREKPFLYVDSSSNYNVFVPTLRTESSGPSWVGGGLGTGYSLPISTFFIATPSSTLDQINAALTSGENLILTPGLYKYAGSINITNPNTIVLGLGYADVIPQAGTAAFTVADVDGVQIAGLLITAGPTNSPSLLQVGNVNGPRVSHQANPTSINDVHIRVGGPSAGQATTSIEIDSDNVILDNNWIWRADHGTDASWTGNVAAHGLVVNGDNVTALGLGVEHYQQNQVLWNGNGGETIFYQSEMPYDPPSQSAWMNGSSNGYSSYAVSSGVTTHKAYGLGVYSNFNKGVAIVADSAITVPASSGVTVTDAMTYFLGSQGGGSQITHIVNNAGLTSSVTSSSSYLPFYRGAPCSSDCPIEDGPSQLQTTTSLTKQSDGSYIATVTIANSGNGTAQKAVLNSLTLGSATGTPAGLSLGNIAPGGSVTASLSVPASAGASGSHVVEKVNGAYTGGTFGGSYRATLP